MSVLARRIRATQAGVIVVAGVATLVVSVLPPLTIAYRSAAVHAGLETAALVVSVVAAYLLYGRFRNRGRMSDLVLFMALVLLAAANLSRILAPSLTEMDSDNFAVWIPLTVSALAAVAIAASAFVPTTPVRGQGVTLRLTVASIAALAVGVTLVAVLSPHLATGIDPGLSPADSGRPRIVGAPGLLAAQIVLLGLYAAAAVGFTRRAERTGDELMAWLAIAATLGAFARVNYFLFPSGDSEWVFTGDVFRVALYTAILVGALRQISAYQHRAAEAAVFEERRRIARDLHDGLAQELAYISGQARALSGSNPRAAGIVEAADHALADSRGTILALTGPADEPVSQAIARVASALAKRSRTELELDLDDTADVAPAARDELLLVLREAISNAVRHGGPSTVCVSLEAGERLRLTISDDGSGFDGEPHSAGLGLANMRERVQGLGGELRLSSDRGRGTKVEAVLP